MAAQYQLPDWFNPNPDQHELDQQYAGLGSLYDTSGLQQAYGQQMGYNISDSAARGSAMAAAAQNRARRNGGQVAASFAAGSANLGAYRQNAEMLLNLEQMKMTAANNRAQMGAQLASQLASGRQNATNTQASLYNAGSDRLQQNQQFGRSLAQNESQFGRSLDQSGSQFDRNLAQQGSQFGQNLDYQNRALNQSGSEFQQSFGAQQQNDQFARLQAALQLTPQVSKYGEVGGNGVPVNGFNNFRLADTQNAKRAAIQNQLRQYAGF